MTRKIRGNPSKIDKPNLRYTLEVDKITVPFDWEFHQGIKFTCCTLLRFVAEQQLSSRAKSVKSIKLCGVSAVILQLIV